MIRSVVALVFVGLALACGAPQRTQEEIAARYVELNAPLEQHGVLAVLEGTYAAEVRTWNGPDAEPVDFRGLIENRLVLGRRFLQSTYRSDLGEYGVMEGVGLLGYNSFEGRYESFWTDTFSTTMPPVAYGHAEADGTELHFESRAYDPQLDRVQRTRTVTRIQDRRTHTFEMYVDGPDGEEFLQVRIVYTKI